LRSKDETLSRSIFPCESPGEERETRKRGKQNEEEKLNKQVVLNSLFFVVVAIYLINVFKKKMK
jgi:hypothetical protein